jgi:hypothetical protein
MIFGRAVGSSVARLIAFGIQALYAIIVVVSDIIMMLLITS